jgi:hypothetical protein
VSKYVSVKDSNGYSFSHNFSTSDWNAICTLCGQSSGRVQLSEGSASTDGDTVFISLDGRIYDISASDLF